MTDIDDINKILDSIRKPAKPSSQQRMVRRWQWSWHRCKPFQVRVTWWGDKRLTVQKGFHVWAGWWRLSAVYLEMEAPNEKVSDHADSERGA